MSPLYPQQSGASGLGAAVFGGSIPGQWYLPDVNLEGGGTSALSYSTMYALPKILKAGTIVGMAARHFATPTAGETFRMGIYADNGTGYPGALVVDAGTIDLSTTAAVKAVTISQVVTDGLYWLVGVKQGSGSVSTMLTFTALNTLAPARSIMPAVADFQTRYLGFSHGSVTAALPGTFTATPAYVAASTPMPVLAVKY